jgi:hypothetical protein
MMSPKTPTADKIHPLKQFSEPTTDKNQQIAEVFILN